MNPAKEPMKKLIEQNRIDARLTNGPRVGGKFMLFVIALTLLIVLVVNGTAIYSCAS